MNTGWRLNRPPAWVWTSHDIATGELRHRLPDCEGTVYWLAWQPGAPRSENARDNGALGIWNLSKIDAQLDELGLKPPHAPYKARQTQAQ